MLLPHLTQGLAEPRAQNAQKTIFLEKKKYPKIHVLNTTYKRGRKHPSLSSGSLPQIIPLSCYEMIFRHLILLVGTPDTRSPSLTWSCQNRSNILCHVWSERQSRRDEREKEGEHRRSWRKPFQNFSPNTYLQNGPFDSWTSLMYIISDWRSFFIWFLTI